MQPHRPLLKHSPPSPLRRLAPLAAVLATALEASAQTAPAQPAGSQETAPARPVSAVLTGTARAEYEAGLILFQAGDHGNAIIKLERAYELSREPRILWHIALCHWNLKHYSRVIITAEQLLRDAGPSLSPQDRKDAEDLIEGTKPYVSRLDLRASEAQATVLVDDREVGTTPLQERVLLDVGRREIRIAKPGFKEAKVVREVAGGGETAVSLSLQKEIHRGRLLVAAGPNDLIALDGKTVGRGSWEGSLTSGGHTLRVTAKGMIPEQQEVMLKDDQARRLDVRLTQTPVDNLGRWLWIGGGAALLAGAIVAGALVFRPEPPVPGNIEPGSVPLASQGSGLVVRFGGGL